VVVAARTSDPGFVSAVSEGSAAPVATTREAAVTRRTLVEVVVAAGLVAAVLMAPLVGWAALHRTATTARLSRAAAEELGAKDAGLDPRVFDRLSRIIPPRATYWVGASPRIRSSTTRGAFPLWASGSLLPRILVARPQAAGWVVTWGYRPDRLPVEVRDVRVLAVRTPPRLPVYVARVVR
jgi:hypothetical protein